MDNEIKKILDNYEESTSNFSEVKKILSKHVESLGTLEQNIDLQKGILRDIDESDSNNQFISSTLSLSQKIAEQSRNYLGEIRIFEVSGSSDSTASMVNTAGTLLVSAVAAGITFKNNYTPISYTKLVTFIEQNDYRPEIHKKLSTINPAWAEEYDNAWKSLNMLTKDKTRSPMFLMRGVMNNLLYIHFAPDKEVENYCKEQQIPEYKNEQSRIRHTIKIKFIASKIADKSKREAFLTEGKAFIEINNYLSSAKNPNELNQQITKDFLYQANELIKLLLDSFDTNTSS